MEQSVCQSETLSSSQIQFITLLYFCAFHKALHMCAALMLSQTGIFRLFFIQFDCAHHTLVSFLQNVNYKKDILFCTLNLGVSSYCSPLELTKISSKTPPLKSYTIKGQRWPSICFFSFVCFGGKGHLWLAHYKIIIIKLWTFPNKYVVISLEFGLHI